MTTQYILFNLCYRRLLSTLTPESKTVGEFAKWKFSAYVTELCHLSQLWKFECTTGGLVHVTHIWEAINETLLEGLLKKSNLKDHFPWSVNESMLQNNSSRILWNQALFRLWRWNKKSFISKGNSVLRSHSYAKYMRTKLICYCRRSQHLT